MAIKAILVTLLLALYMLLLPAGVLAVEVKVDSSSYLSLREKVNEKQRSFLYEYLDVEANQIGGKYFSFSAGGWLRLDAGNEWRNNEEEGELSHAFVDFKFKSSSVRLGRMYVIEGAATAFVDGVHAKTDLPGGFNLAVFSGAPVEEVWEDVDADKVYGARVGHTLQGRYSVGVSCLKQEGETEKFDRDETGVDLWLRPVSSIDFNGISNYNAAKSRLMEHSYYLMLGPFKDFRINGIYSFVDYGAFFSAPTLGVFAADLDPQEELTQAGGNVNYNFGGAYTATAEYSNYNYRIKGDADFYGSKLSYAWSNYQSGLSLHRMSGQTSDLRYYQHNAYVRRSINKADITLNLFDVSYDEKINGVEHAYGIVTALGYDISKNARAGVDFEYSENPFRQNDLKGFLKFIYTFPGGQ